MAAKYYFMIRENPVYSDFFTDKSVYVDSTYLNYESSAVKLDDQNS